MIKMNLIILALFTLVSCSSDEVTVNSENITLSNTETYEKVLGYPTPEDGPRISTQAEHYLISEFITNENITYTYKAAEGFVGTDLVRIEFITGSDGNSAGSVSSILEIRFNVTE